MFFIFQLFLSLLQILPLILHQFLPLASPIVAIWVGNRSGPTAVRLLLLDQVNLSF